MLVIMPFWWIGCQRNILDTGEKNTEEEHVVDSADTAQEEQDSGVDSQEEGSQEWIFEGDTVLVQWEPEGSLRTYHLSSTHTQRDGASNERTITEQQGDPILRSGVVLTDALFAMAVEEARENSVSMVQDGPFVDPQSCDCYETGALWNWVWTRDIAYATALGLAWLDTERAKNSLLFTLSQQKSGGGLEIVQDTGTGGSWPVSTDRVTWARGAMAVLQYSDDAEFRSVVVEAMRNTAERDRAYVFDVGDGLYFGESSFLDWREQSYPSWVTGNPVHIAMSKTLSTNLNHLFLLRSLEELTGEEHHAADLAAAIDTHFWDGTAYRSFLHSTLNPAATHQQDLLATSLAILDLGTHLEALAQYPHSAVGAPVIFPQQQQTPIYHNRAIWPFVSSYALLAAKKANNGAVFDAQLNSLVRGAALNLSNMENLEWQTGNNWVEDGTFSGPVLNSRRQLWSVAGFLGAVVHGVFGVRKEAGEWSSDPVMPSRWFAPDAVLRLDGQEFSIGTDVLDAGFITIVDEGDWRNLYSARVPELAVDGTGNEVVLTFSSTETDVFDVFRDGVRIAQGVSSPWSQSSATTGCYSVVAHWVHPSHATAPMCWWGDEYQRIQTIGIEDFVVEGGVFSYTHGRPHYDNWGAPEHVMETQVTAQFSGKHYVQLVYGNGANSVSSGISAAVKWISIADEAGVEIAAQSVVMPQLGNWDVWGDSTFVAAQLEAGTRYTIRVSDGWNMSYLEHYRNFAGNGGGEDPYNFVNIAELKLLFLR